MWLKTVKKTWFSESNQSAVRRFLIWFYLIGVTGILLPLSADFFKTLTPWALCLNFLILLAYHRPRGNERTFTAFALIYASGLMIEIIGVQTGRVFGHYLYGNTLGPKIWGTPLIIGLNWLLLCYASMSVASRWSLPVWVRVIGAAVLMLAYDLILEQVAPSLDFWHWKDASVPAQNYLAWLIIAILMNTALAMFRVNTQNPMAMVIFFAQIAFFSLIWLSALIT